MPRATLSTSWRVAVLAGGDSAERAVSVRSGAAVASALAAAGYRVTLIDPSEYPEAASIPNSGATAGLSSSASREKTLLDKPAVAPGILNAAIAKRVPITQVDWSHFDAAFIALHGGAGEDGRIQQELEALNVPYTGSGPVACRLAMSKIAAKARFNEQGVPTPPFVSFEAGDLRQHIAARLSRLGYPLIIKPDGQGSSLGVTPVDSPDGLAAAISAAAQFDSSLVAESFVRGREFTVAVLFDRPLPLLEIVSPGRVFSYESKYHSAATQYRFDFELDRESRERLVRAAVGAARSLGAAGLARVDLMLDQSRRVWVLEVNTSPGMSERSLAPQAAAQEGIDMPRLCSLLVEECLSRAAVA